jgi:glycosyltransferase involved in cell wall biosynthesis
MSAMEEGGRRTSGGGFSENDEPTFTVITAVRNGGAAMEQTIRSLGAQTFRNFEYIVLDAGSTDGTVGLLRRSSGLIDYWRSEPDSGIYDAWNKGLALARGRWISFLGAGDEYYPDALDQYADFLARSGRADALRYVSSKVDLAQGDRLLGTIGQPWRWDRFSRYMCVAHVGSIHSRELFSECGSFDTRYQICGDYELLLRPRASLSSAYLPVATARMSYGGVSVSGYRPALLEARRAKSTTGGRSAWRCALEFKYAEARAIVRGIARPC